MVGAWQARLRLQSVSKPAPPAMTEQQQTVLAQMEQRAAAAPSDLDLQEQLATLYVSLHREEDAEQVMQRLCQVDAANPQAWLRLGDLETKIDRLTLAADAYQQAWKLAPRDVEIICALAQVELNADHLERAAALLKQAEKVAPQAALPHFFKGQLLLRTAITEVAIPEFQRAVALRPDYVPGWLALALALLQTKQLTATEAACRQLMRLDTQNAGALGIWAQAKMEEGTPPDIAAARRLAAQSLSIQPRQAGSHYVLGVLSLRANDLAGAVTHLEAALKIDPTRLDVRSNLVKTYQRAGRAGDAEQQLKILDAQADYSKKVEVLNAQIQMHPQEADWHLRLAELHASIGVRSKAMHEYERALELNPKLPQAQTALQQLKDQMPS